MKHITLAKIPAGMASLAYIFIAHAANAQVLDKNIQNKISGQTGLGSADVRDTASSIVGAFLGLLAIIALILIVYAGFKWMTAGGNEEQVTTAKKTLQAAIIGLIIVMGSYGISLYVFTIIEGATGQGAIT